MKSISQKLKQLSSPHSSPTFIQPINVKIELKVQRPYQIVNEEQPSIVSPSFSNVQIDPQCIKQLSQQLKKNKFSKEGVLLSYQSLSEVKKLHIFTGINQQQDLTSLIQNQQCLCVGVCIVKDCNTGEDRGKQFIKRIRNQLKFCMEYRSGTGSNRHAENYSKLSEIGKLYCKQSRMFVIFQKKNDQTIMHTLHYYPNISFGVREIKLQPQKIKEGEVLDRIAHMKYPKNSYGYMTQDVKGAFIFEDRNNPKINKQILVGVWIVGEQGLSKNEKDKEQVIEKRNKLFWRVIVEYLRKPKLKRVSTLQENTGILAYFERKTLHRKLYLFDLNGFSNKWHANYSSQVVNQVPQEIDFTKKCTVQNQESQQEEQCQRNQHLGLFSDNKGDQQLGTEVNQFNKKYNQYPSPQHVKTNLRDRQMHTKSAPRQRLQMQKELSAFNFNQGLAQKQYPNFYRPPGQYTKVGLGMTGKEQEQRLSATMSRHDHINIQDRQIDMHSLRQPSECRSYQSLDQRDVEISLLKKDLEMYKAKYQQLKRIHDPMFNCFMRMISSGVFQNGTFMVHGINNQFDLMNSFGSYGNQKGIVTSHGSGTQTSQQQFQRRETNQRQQISSSGSNKQISQNSSADYTNQRTQFIKNPNIQQKFTSNRQQEHSNRFTGKQQITFGGQKTNEQNNYQQEYRRNIQKPVARSFIKKNYSLPKEESEYQIEAPTFLNKKQSEPTDNRKKYQDDSSEEFDTNQHEDYKNISFGDSNSRFKQSFGKSQLKEYEVNNNLILEGKQNQNRKYEVDDQSKNTVDKSNRVNRSNRVDSASKMQQKQLEQSSDCFNQSPQFKITRVHSSQKTQQQSSAKQDSQKRLKSANMQARTLFKRQNHSDDSEPNQQTSYKTEKNKQIKDIEINIRQTQPKGKKGKISLRQMQLELECDSSDQQQFSLDRAKFQKQNMKRNTKKSSENSDSDDDNQVFKKLTKKYQPSRQVK